MTLVMIYGVFRHYTANDDSLFEMNRTYVVVLLLWIAWPELEALPRWFLTFVILVGLVCAWRPQYLVFTIPALFLYLLFRPLPGKRKKKSVGDPSSTLIKKK